MSTNLSLVCPLQSCLTGVITSYAQSFALGIFLCLSKGCITSGKPDIVQLAVERKRKVLDEFFPDHVDEAMDRWLRENYTIHLPKEAMRPA